MPCDLLYCYPDYCNGHTILLHCTGLYLNEPHCIALNCVAHNCTVLRFTALNVCHLLHCITLHCTPLHCNTVSKLHLTALHCTELHCTALHCIELHCTALHFFVLHCCTSMGNGLGNLDITFTMCVASAAIEMVATVLTWEHLLESLRNVRVP